MGATYQRRGKHAWRVCVHYGRERERTTVHSEQDAKDLVKFIHKQELAGVNVVETIRQARTSRLVSPAAPTTSWQTPREALPEFIRQMETRGDWTGSTPINYRRRLEGYVYGFALPDGRKLGDLPVDQVTEQMIGAVLDRARSSSEDGTRKGKSLAIQEHIRSPLKRFYRDLIRKGGFSGPNPAADLKDYMASTPPNVRAKVG